MNIEKALRNYKKNKGKIEATEERDKHWQYCLDTMSDEEIASEFVYEKQDTYGMPKAKNNESPVETEVIIKEVTREMIKQWIEDDKSRIKSIQHEIKLIDIALGSLTEEENYIIECKYIDNWKWVQVEIGFNDKYRNENGVTVERLKDIKENALKKMNEIVNI